MDVEPCEARSPPPRHGSCYSLTHTAPAYAAIRPEMYGIDRRVFLRCAGGSTTTPTPVQYSNIYMCVYLINVIIPYEAYVGRARVLSGRATARAAQPSRLSASPASGTRREGGAPCLARPSPPPRPDRRTHAATPAPRARPRPRGRPKRGLRGRVRTRVI